MDCTNGEIWILNALYAFSSHKKAWKRPNNLLNQESICSSIYLGLIKVGKEAILKICVAYKQCRISFLFYCNVQFIFQCVLVRLALGIEISSNSLINKATKLTKKNYLKVRTTGFIGLIFTVYSWVTFVSQWNAFT